MKFNLRKILITHQQILVKSGLRLCAWFGFGVPDLDALETSVRDGLPGCGAKGYAALLEALDAHFL